MSDDDEVTVSNLFFKLDDKFKVSKKEEVQKKIEDEKEITEINLNPETAVNFELDLSELNKVSEEMKESTPNTRAAERLQYSGPVIIHKSDSQKSIKADLKDINSLGGVGIKVENGVFELGQILTIEFVGTTEYKSFTLNAEVVSFLEGEGSASIGLKLIKLSKLGERRLEEFIKSIGNTQFEWG